MKQYFYLDQSVESPAYNKKKNLATDLESSEVKRLYKKLIKQSLLIREQLHSFSYNSKWQKQSIIKRPTFSITRNIIVFCRNIRLKFWVQVSSFKLPMFVFYMKNSWSLLLWFTQLCFSLTFKSFHSGVTKFQFTTTRHWICIRYYWMVEVVFFSSMF